jgi:hypothetical protein
MRDIRVANALDARIAPDVAGSVPGFLLSGGFVVSFVPEINSTHSILYNTLGGIMKLWMNKK